ncbi:MAG TPA: glycine--tRNA ligase subunit beta [Rhizomicrobium sp.]|jgi:glycyl-tRNA synthetase beta chain|nr:glycine--tRNA ligase subunit beta [Rhizomicrobium sp.]
MADLLLELFSEEIPARMQAQAAKDLERLVVGALSDRGLLFEGFKAFAGPRRLTLAVAGLPAKQPDVSEELKGPKVDAPAAAVEGFLKKTGLTREQLTVQETPKGKVYLAVIKRDGRPTADVLSEILPECFGKLPWPKSMRWPQATNAPVRWVRPLHSILCTLDGEVVPLVFAGVTSGNTTRGHRFLSTGVIEARRFEDYEKKLHDAHVILDAEQRKAIIFEGVKGAAFVHGLELIADEGLLDEVAGLAEWPVVLLGTIEDQFMDVPPEILQTAMRVHQKYFALRDPKTGKMANRFALVANMIADDAGKQIVAGNERVLRARLSDAKFFWDQDRKTKLADRVDALDGIVFHELLGSQLERVNRIEELAGSIAAKIDASVVQAKRAARLAKADLVTGVVGEFPELQGVMGGYYATSDGECAEVADAVRDHYKPQGPSDVVPSSRVTIAVALADKIDVLVGFFSNGKQPSGSSDPFALRRAALGAIRLLLVNNIQLSLRGLFVEAALNLIRHRRKFSIDVGVHEYILAVREPMLLGASTNAIAFIEYGDRVLQETVQAYVNDVGEPLLALMQFFADRLKAVLREKGTRHDLIDAVFSLGHEDDLVRLVARVEALQAFLKTDDGANLLAGYKRAANILKAEEKKDGQIYAGEVLESHLTEASEVALFAALTRAKAAIDPALEAEDFAGAMTVMAGLRAPVDAFFGAVKVNVDDPVVRANRLNLLGALRATLLRVADFSKIEG